MGRNSSIYIASFNFFNNAATMQGGGAIYSNSCYSNISLMMSNFTHNSASYYGMLDVDEFCHFNVTIRDSIFLFNMATDQNLGGGVACIRNASTKIIGSTFNYNHAALLEGVFYIDEMTF